MQETKGDMDVPDIVADACICGQVEVLLSGEVVLDDRFCPLRRLLVVLPARRCLGPMCGPICSPSDRGPPFMGGLAVPQFFLAGVAFPFARLGTAGHQTGRPF